MRFAWFVGMLGLVPGQLVAEQAVCEYRHPDHPSWNFFTTCTVETTSEGGVTTYSVAVSNGSRFTAQEMAGTGGDMGFSVNGLSATRLERDESRCYLTDAEAELICIHPEGTALAEPPLAAPAPVSTGGTAAGFGGGVSGFCLLTALKDGTETLIDYGACVKRENCLVSDTGGTTCVTDYDWKAGRITEMARAEGWQTLDGGAARATSEGCFSDDGAGVSFCFARKEMTATDHPVLGTAMQ